MNKLFKTMESWAISAAIRAASITVDAALRLLAFLVLAFVSMRLALMRAAVKLEGEKPHEQTF